MCFSFQILPAANIGQLEDHWQDIAQPVGGLAEPGRPQDPYHLNVAYQGMADYHPLMPGVSNFFQSIWYQTNENWSIGACGCPIHIPQCRTCPRYPGPTTRASQCSSGFQHTVPIYVLNQILLCRRIETMALSAMLLSMLHWALLTLPSLIRLFTVKGPPLPTN